MGFPEDLSQPVCFMVNFAEGLFADPSAKSRETVPAHQYPQDGEGFYHITGQITVDNGLVTKIYLAKP